MPDQVIITVVQDGFDRVDPPMLGVTAYSLAGEEMSITINGRKQFFDKCCTRIVVEPEGGGAEIANSGAPYTSQASNGAVCMATLMRSVLCMHIAGLGLNTAQYNATIDDSEWLRLMELLTIAEMAQIKVQCDVVSVALAGWDTTIRDHLKGMCDSWTTKFKTGITALAITGAGTTPEANGDYALIEGRDYSTNNDGMTSEIVVTVAAGIISAIASIDKKGFRFAAADTLTVNQINGVAMTANATLTVSTIG